jgi:tungstate transport system ATP-binding protein
MIQQMIPPIFEIKSIRHAYAGKTVLQIDRLAISPGSIVGLIGPNGSGKSTLLRLLGLIEKPDQGEIRYNGQRIFPFSSFARFDITLLPQEPFLMKRSVFQNISFGLKLREGSDGTVFRAHEALSLTGLGGEDFLKRPWYALSVGEMQRVALAARLALRPKVLLLDEPTASVDAASAKLIKDAALTARKDWQTTLIIAGHDRQWLDEVCDTMLHLHKGVIFGAGYETLILGPWKELGKGLWGKKLPDGQTLNVSAPPDQSATALINDFSISATEIAGNPGHRVLCGTVSRLTWKKSSGLIAAAVMAGDVPFFVDLTGKQVKDQCLIPGKNVFIHYHDQKIKWI